MNVRSVFPPRTLARLTSKRFVYFVVHRPVQTRRISRTNRDRGHRHCLSQSILFYAYAPLCAPSVFVVKIYNSYCRHNEPFYDHRFFFHHLKDRIINILSGFDCCFKKCEYSLITYYTLYGYPLKCLNLLSRRV